MNFSTEEHFTYDDMLLVPRFSDIMSRADVDLSGGRLKLKLPVISANMDTVTEEDMMIAMGREGAFGICHRFLNPQRLDQVIVRTRAAGHEPAISIGINKDSDDLLEVALKHKVRYYTIDVAHGHHVAVLTRTSQIRDLTSNLDATIIVGNVVTGDAVAALADAGAHIVKVGVGPGSHCTTRVVTGHGYPQLTAVANCAFAASKCGVEIIADGGIRNSGDIAKALGAGANYVMLGRMLAGTDESPGEKMTSGGIAHKVYRGMASFEAQAGAARKTRAPEGVASKVKYKGPVSSILKEIKDGLQSALSYSGARTLEQFRDVAEFIRVTHNSYIEGLPHGTL